MRTFMYNKGGAYLNPEKFTLFGHTNWGGYELELLFLLKMLAHYNILIIIMTFPCLGVVLTYFTMV